MNKNAPLHEVREVKNLRDVLYGTCDEFGSKVGYKVKDEPGGPYRGITFNEFKKDVESLGTYLYTKGYKGSRIAVIGENSYEWAVSYLSTVNGLGIVVPIDKELSSGEISQLLKRAKVDVLIYSDKVADKINDLRSDSENIKLFINMHSDNSNSDEYLYNIINEGKKILEDGDLTYVEAEINEEEMSILLFTSGTTQSSKAVMLSHENIAKNLMAMCSMLYIDENDTFLSVLPLHHTYECTCGFLCPLYRGCTVAYCEGLRHITKNLKESEATIMLGVPLLFENMYNKIMDTIQADKKLYRKFKLGLKIVKTLKVFNIDKARSIFSDIHDKVGGHMRLFISGAAGIDPNVSKGLRDIGLLTVQGYGLTECAPIVALNRGIYYKDDAAGLPLPGLDVKIVDPDTENIGEIVVKGPSVMLGYYEDKEATEEVMINGWFHTGDLGYIDKDGFVHITGRKKNVIITKNGKNVFPEEIESVLLKNKYISEVILTGEEENDDLIITAIIYPDYEKIENDYKNKILSTNNPNDVMKDVIRRYNEDAVIYKKIKKFNIRKEEFEKTTTKKIKRYKL